MQKINSMAATVNLGQQLQFENVSHLPPRAPSSNGRPWSGCFHNRGRLFPTRKQQPTIDTASAHKNSSLPSYSTPCPPNQNGTTDSVTSSVRHCRVQSAKARLERSHAENPSEALTQRSTDVCPGNDIAVYDVNMNLNLKHKPTRQNSRSHSKDSNQFLYQVSLNQSMCRPSSAKTAKNLAWMPSLDLTASGSEEKEELGEDLKPSVFGYRLKRQVYGSNPDIFSSTQRSSQPTTMFKLDETEIFVSKKEEKLNGDIKNAVACIRTIPKHMEPLRPWLTQAVTQEVTGIDPSTCLVFLPLNQTFDNLPVVPLQ